MHVPGHLSIGSHSKWNARANALFDPQLKEREMAAPGAHCDTLPQLL